MFYIYIIYSEASDRYYVGYSSDFESRLVQHNDTKFKNTYTSKHAPWILKAAFECGNSESTAVRVEKFLKRQKSRRLLERMISGEKLTGILSPLIIVR